MSDDQKACFDKFDADGSGQISARELVTLLAEIFPDKSDTDVKAIAHTCLKQADKDDDGKISWEEFKCCLCD